MAQAKSRKEKGRDQDTASNGEVRDSRGKQQHQISQERAGVNQAGYSGRFQGSSGRTREDEDLKSISSQTDSTGKDLEALRQEELTGSGKDEIRAAGYSDTDEDEDEGLGDGNLGRSVRGSVEE
jgi:hypothetical protein